MKYDKSLLDNELELASFIPSREIEIYKNMLLMIKGIRDSQKSLKRMRDRIPQGPGNQIYDALLLFINNELCKFKN
jgi:hypothetical protein